MVRLVRINLRSVDCLGQGNEMDTLCLFVWLKTDIGGDNAVFIKVIRVHPRNKLLMDTD